MPINFNLKSIEEKENIAYIFENFLKKFNYDFQMIVKTKREEMNEKIRSNLKNKESPLAKEYINCVKSFMQNDYVYIKKFYFIYSTKFHNNQGFYEIKSNLEKAFYQVKDDLNKCGNKVVDITAYDENVLGDILYSLVNE